MTDGNDKLLTSEEAAGFLGLNQATLANWRYLGKGPPFVRIAARTIRYRMEDLRAWVERKTTTPVEPVAPADDAK